LSSEQNQLTFEFDAPEPCVPLPDKEVVSEARPSSQQYAQPITVPEGFSLSPQQVKGGKPAPIAYQLKVSAKARQVYLRVEPGRGLQVTIPKRYAKRSIPALVESQRKWIIDALADLDSKTPPIYRQWPPPQLQLAAENAMVHVTYKQNANADSATIQWLASDHLQLTVDANNKAMVAKCIAEALKPRAREVLGPWLAGCAQRSGLSYKRMSIRGQRTVWGSFSSSGTLSLNYKLLFLAPDLVDYVLIHELAHTRYLDHSPTFWRFVEELKPNSLELDSQLKEAGSFVPPWLELAA